MALSWWLRRTKERLERARPARGAKYRRPVCRPTVEVMEDRLAPASRLFAVPILAAPGAGQILELNPTTGAVVATLPAPQPGTTTGEVGLAFDGSRLFYLNGGADDRLYELNPDTGAVLDSDPIPGGSGGYDGLAVVGGQVFVQDYAADRVIVFDPVTDTVVRTFQVGVTGPADLLGGLAGASDALIGTINGSVVATINPATGAIVSTFSPGVSNLLGAAVVGNDIYLGSANTSTIFRFTRAGAPLASITPPFRVGALASDDTTGVSPPPAPGAQFVNGNFETGSTTGWTVFNQNPVGAPPSPGFQAYTGANPIGSQLPAPPQGAFAAYVNHNSPGTYILYQDVALPAGQFHTLSLMAYYNNIVAGRFATPETLALTGTANQQFRIDVVTTTGDLLSTAPGVVLVNVFRTDVGEPNVLAPTALTADLTPFAGQTVRLRVAVATSVGPLYAAVDDVRLTSTGAAPTGTVAGVKFNDLDGDGTRDAGEPGLADWTIYADTNNNRRRDAGEPFAVTDATGAYSFAVPIGTHTIREVAQAGWVQTAPAADRLFSARAGNNGAVQVITEHTATGAVLNTFTGPAPVTFQGPQGLAFSGDSLFYINGQQSPPTTPGPHTLYELDPATGAVLDSDVLPATQEIAGLAYLGGLVYVQVHPNNQVVVFDPATDTVVRTFTVPADIIGGMTGAADLGLLFATNGQGQVFAINPQTGAVVRTMNPGVGPLTGGLAYFRGELIAGNFGPVAFRINPQTGALLGNLTLSGPGGGIVGLAGDGRAAGGARVTFAVNQTVTLDFGNRRDEGTVTGVKYDDRDGDGTRDAGEPALPGWTVYADLNNNRRLDPGEPSAVTGADGSYALTVPSGTHTIREVAQAGWVQTAPLSYTLYGTAADGTLLTTINTATGTAAVVGPFGSVQTSSVAVTPDGGLWTIVNPFNSTAARLARVDPATGFATPVGGAIGSNGPIIALEADAAGNLFGASFGGQLYRLDRATGAATLVGQTGFTNAQDLAFDPAGGLWALDGGARLFRVDPATGASILWLNFVATAGFPTGLAIHPGTGVFYVTSTGAALHTLDPTTGQVTRVGGSLGVSVSPGLDFATNDGHAVTITPGAALTGRDFGNRRDEGTVSGVKYEDVDGDGTRDAGEAALPGWTVYADTNNNGRLDPGEPSAVTGADGSYALTLPSGPHAIREVPQAGWVQTGPGSDRVFALRPTSPTTLNVVELDPLGFAVNTFPAPVASFGLQGLAVGRDSLFYVDGSNPATGTRTLYELDAFTGAVLDADVLPVVGGAVSGLAYLDGLVYVLNSSGNQIVVVNPATDTVVRTLQPTFGTLFGGLTGAADLGLLFATSGSLIAAIDPVSGLVVRVFGVGGGPALSGGLAYRAGELLGVALSTSPQPILRIDPVTGGVRGALFPVGPNTTGLGGDGPLPGPHRVTVTAGAALAGRDFGNQRVAPPVAADDAATVGEDATLTVPAPGVLANDTGVYGARAVVAVNNSPLAVGRTIFLPSGSLLRVDSTGRFVYTPGATFQSLAAGETVEDSFTYTMVDGLQQLATALVVVTVTGTNDAPVARNDSATTTEDTVLTVPVPGVLANDTDPDAGATLSVVAVAGGTVGTPLVLPSGATVTVFADGRYTYDPRGAFDHLAPGETATDSFVYTASDGTETSSAQVFVTVTGVNDTPVAEDLAVAALEDDPVVTAAFVAEDAEPGPLTFTVVTPPAAGSVVNNDDGTFSFLPGADFQNLPVGAQRVVTFTYTAADADGGVSNPATVTVTVTGANDGPTAVADTGETDEDTVLAVTTPGLLANDTDPDANETLAVAAVNGDPAAVGVPVGLASGAVLTVLGDGSYTYDPSGAFEALGVGQSATDTFEYTVTDSQGATSTATVTITVRGVNDAPVANPDSYATDEDTDLEVLAAGVLANDTDVDGDALAAAVLAGPANGTVTVNADGSFTYRPAANFHGTDSFTYTASDGNGGTATGTVSIEVRPVNDAPTLAPAAFTVAENSPNGTPVGTVTGADVDGDALTYSIVAGNTLGAFAIDAATGALTVANAAALDFETTPTFALTVEVRDPAGLTAAATVTVNLSNVVEVRIDIEPNDDRNRINSRSNGKVSVALLSTYEFNALLVNPFTLRFGRTGQENSLSRVQGLIPRVRYTDVNRDGRLDMVVEFETELTGFRPGDTRGILTGEFWNGVAFSAEDVVSVR